jgi:hypothetical protein
LILILSNVKIGLKLSIGLKLNNRKDYNNYKFQLLIHGSNRNITHITHTVKAH